MAKLVEIHETKRPTAEQIAQLERAHLRQEFGEEIGDDLWQYQNGLQYLKNATPEQRIGLLRVSETELANHITNALGSDSDLKKFQAVRALIRIATINGNK